MKKEYLYFHQDILILTLHMYNYKPRTGLKTDKEFCQQVSKINLLQKKKKGQYLKKFNTGLINICSYP